MMRSITTFACLTVVFGLTFSRADQQPDDEDLKEQALKAAVQKVGPTVVQIETSGGTETIAAGPGGRRIVRGNGPTTGLIVGADGYIVTSAFNFANKPTSIIVAVPGRKERFVAKPVATDQTRMLTLLKIDATGLPLPTAIPKADFKVGQTSLAVGRTLVQNPDDPPSVSEGIISAVGRIWGKAVQTDAKVSPTNYGGPLMDMEGRVFGVLVPASPRAEGETAGFEWYDSGIGFAMPLDDIYRVLPRFKQGKDLHRGVLGVTMRNRDEFADEPVVGGVNPGSPAETLGIKPGDIVRKIDGKDVYNFAQMRHALGSKYEDDTVALEIERDKKIEKYEAIKLGGEVAAFNQSFLGILPMRDDPDAGVLVRFVFPKSPADAAGVKEGDRITKVGPNDAGLKPVQGRDQLAAAIAAVKPGAKLVFEVMPKDSKEAKDAKKLNVTLGDYLEAVPEKLPEKASLEKAQTPKKPIGAPVPPAPPKDEKKDEKKDDKKGEKGKAPTGLLERMNVARDKTYWIYVPEDYNPNVSHAIVLWLHPVGKNKKKDMETMVSLWEDYCSKHHIILVMPASANETGWVGGEADFVQEALRSVFDMYTVDRRRVVAHGMGVGGQMAFYMGFSARDLIRGVATTGAVLTSNPKERQANQPLAFFLTVGEKDPILDQVKASQAKLQEYRYPILLRELKEKGHQYFDFDTEATFKEMIRWIDSLDRL